MKKSKKKVSKPVKKSGAVRASAPVKQKSSVGVVPMGDRVLIKPLSPEESGAMTAFGIIIPDTAKEKPEQGTVVAVGPGRRGDDGSAIPMTVQVGDRVMFSKYGYDEIKVGGVEYFILPESSILAVIEK